MRVKLTESQEQILLFEWCSLFRNKYLELDLLYHVPNGGHRHVAVATKLKREGVKSGVPDLFLPVARDGYHGLFIEMKAIGGRTSPNQKNGLMNCAVKVTKLMCASVLKKRKKCY